eukprot:GAFH01000792.1.p2 GENE.GAFH01000792.1~~GAFH01000792.1.p2  ORF type:complete len:893 (-),score=505.86 GAFH01000792.1:264-2867(-)
MNDGCTSNECRFIQGLLQGLGFSIDLNMCLTDVDQAIALAQKASTEYQSRQYQKAVFDFADALDITGKALSACQLQGVAQLIEGVAKDLHLANITVLSQGVQILVNGANIYDDLLTIAKSISSQDYTNFGVAVSDLLMKLQAASCNTPTCIIVEGLLKAFGQVLPHMKQCTADIDSAWQQLGTFLYDMQKKNTKDAVVQLSQALYTISNAVDDCGLPDLGRLISDEAKKLGLADVVVISDQVVKVLVNGVDVYQNLYQLSQDITTKNYRDMGVRLATLVTEIAATGCTSQSCEVVTGILKMLEIIIPDLQQCEADMTGAMNTIQAAFAQFAQKQYAPAVKQLAQGLSILGQSVSDCGLPDVAALVVAEAKALGLANITVVNDVVHVIVDGVDLYQDIYQAYKDLAAKNYDAFGRDLAVLLSRLQQSGCSSPACVAIEAILRVLHVAIPDLRQCESTVNAGWADLVQAQHYWENKQYQAATDLAASGMAKLGNAVDACGVPTIGHLIVEYSQKLGLANISFVDDIIHVMVEGVDMYEDLYAFFTAMSQKDYPRAATALGAIIADLRLIGCHTPACQVVEGMLEAMKVVLSHLVACEQDLDGAWKYLEQANADFQAKKYSKAMLDLADCLHEVGQGVTACGVPELSIVIDNLVKLLHFHTINVESIVKIVIAGVDVYDDVYNVIEDYQHQQWRQLGRDLGTLINKLYQISGKHCDNDKACLVFEGILEALLVVPDWHACKSDITTMWADVEATAADFKTKSYKHAVHDLSEAGHELSLAVQQCEVQEIAAIIEKLAKKLGFGSIWWIEEVVKILVDATDIFEDVYEITHDVEAHNYLGLGLDLAKLIKLLVLTGANGEPLTVEQALKTL